jgi:hypothetical protein
VEVVGLNRSDHQLIIEDLTDAHQKQTGRQRICIAMEAQRGKASTGKNAKILGHANDRDKFTGVTD